MRPTVSVVVPAHNAERTIRATIRSVYQQTRADDLEVIVVDDGSSDETLERLTELADERLTVLGQEQSGVSAARNLAISHARGRYICPLDADDLLLPQFLETMVGALEQDEDAGFAYTDAWTLDDPTGRVRRASTKAYQRPPRHPPREPHAFFRLLLERNFVYGCTVIRRSTLDEVGGYSTVLSVGEDYELWLRIVAHEFGAIAVPGRLAVYREGQPASVSQNALRTCRDNRRIYELVADSYPVDEATRRRARELSVGLGRREALLRDGRASRRGRALEPVLALRRRILRPFRWARDRPPEIEALLAETGGWPT